MIDLKKKVILITGGSGFFGSRLAKIISTNNGIPVIIDNKLVVGTFRPSLEVYDIETGKLLWSKTNSAPFNSQVKVYKNKIFVVDFENTLKSYSLKDGSLLWEVKTERSFIKSQKKLSIII